MSHYSLSWFQWCHHNRRRSGDLFNFLCSSSGCSQWMIYVGSGVSLATSASTLVAVVHCFSQSHVCLCLFSLSQRFASLRLRRLAAAAQWPHWANRLTKNCRPSCCIDCCIAFFNSFLPSPLPHLSIHPNRSASKKAVTLRLQLVQPPSVINPLSCCLWSRVRSKSASQ